MEKTLQERADEFAERAHSSISQVRKYTNDPYIVHPRAVAKIVASVLLSSEIYAAALLHDVVEDTPVTLDEIRNEFGDYVAELVEMVTDVSRPEDGNRKTRKEIDRQHLAKASPEGKTIKLADLIDNSRNIVEHDPSFAKVYMKEKKELLTVLKDGNERLYKIAEDIVNKYYMDNE